MVFLGEGLDGRTSGRFCEATLPFGRSVNEMKKIHEFESIQFNAKLLCSLYLFLYFEFCLRLGATLVPSSLRTCCLGAIVDF